MSGRGLEPPPKTVPFTVVVRARDKPQPRPSIHDYACALRTLTPVEASACAGRFGVKVSPEDVLAFTGAPLSLLHLDRYGGTLPMLCARSVFAWVRSNLVV